MPQIAEYLRVGELTPRDEISLDRQHWLTIAESGRFPQPQTPDDEGPVTLNDNEQAVWREERERARQRWLEGIDTSESLSGLVLPQDHDQAQRNLKREHDTTRSMLQMELARRPSVWIGLAALLVIIGIGLAVWLGQSGEEPLKPELVKVADCTKPAMDGVSWSGCDKTGASLPRARLRGSNLIRVRLDGADLTGADFTYANLSRASLRGASLRQAAFVGSNLDKADLTGADLTGADLRYATLTGALLDGARLEGAVLDKAAWPDGRVCAEQSLGTCR